MASNYCQSNYTDSNRVNIKHKSRLYIWIYWSNNVGLSYINFIKNSTSNMSFDKVRFESEN